MGALRFRLTLGQVWVLGFGVLGFGLQGFRMVGVFVRSIGTIIIPRDCNTP